MDSTSGDRFRMVVLIAELGRKLSSSIVHGGVKHDDVMAVLM
jgi:hypothetical protein